MDEPRRGVGTLIIATVIVLAAGGIVLGVISWSSNRRARNAQNGQTQGTANTSPTEQNDLVVVVANTPELHMFSEAVKTAEMTTTLTSPGPFTVFAPTDEAVQKLPPESLAGWQSPERRAALTYVLNYHIVPGNLSLPDLSNDQKLKTLQGSDLSIKQEGGETYVLGGSNTRAKIVKGDIKASNGVIHEIDSILVP